MCPVKSSLILSIIFLTIVGNLQKCKCYNPDWKSLDSRPLPKWYDEAKIGIFIHFGIYSVPSFKSEWFWWMWKRPSPDVEIVNFMHRFYPTTFSYPEFAPYFKTEHFNASKWADIFKLSGAKYVVFTSKHHEGFCNWPSAVSWNWNSLDVGPRRDLIGELSSAIRSRTDLEFGLYHSLFEWFNPYFLLDKAANFTTQTFVQGKVMPELYDLVNSYKPSIIWSDGDWDATSEYWRSKEFLAWLYNDSPVKDYVVVNDRWGSDAQCKHGDFVNCADRYHPNMVPNKKWESCVSLDQDSWGFRREADLSSYLSTKNLIETLVDVIVYGGNFLINIGPTSSSTISPIFEERLSEMGRWLKVNNEAIFHTAPWKVQRDPNRSKLWYNQKKSNATTKQIIYAMFGDWPNSKEPKITLASITLPKNGRYANVTLLVADNKQMSLIFLSTSLGLVIDLPQNPPQDTFSVWTIRIETLF